MRIRDHLGDLRRESYVTRSNGSGEPLRVDCSLGINPFGCSDLVSEGLGLSRLVNISEYPDAGYAALKRRILRYWGDIIDGDEGNLMVGTGSYYFIEAVNRLFIDPGDRVLGYCPQFPDYALDVERCGGIYDHADLCRETGFRFDGDSVLRALDPRHKILYIDNPNNPTGQVIALGELEPVVRAARDKDVCVLVDEAYGDFMDRGNSAVGLVNRYDNLLVARSFSKGFGLGGLRIGYAFAGQKMMSALCRIETPITVSSPSAFAAAVALDDGEFLAGCRRKIRGIKERIVEAVVSAAGGDGRTAARGGIAVMETDPEVPIMLLAGEGSGESLYESFRSRGILTEAGSDFPSLGDRYVRLRVPSVGVDLVLDAIGQIRERR